MAGIDVMALGGLSTGSARELLGSALSREVAARLAAETDGNPLALVECRRVMGQAQRTGAAPLPPTLPVPERLRAVFVDGLAALAPGAWRAATPCAALADADLAPVLAALGDEGLDAEERLAGADDAAADRSPSGSSWSAWPPSPASSRRWTRGSAGAGTRPRP